jgi:hypothetical protein
VRHEHRLSNQANSSIERAPFWRSSVIIGALSLTTQYGYNAFYDRYAQVPDESPLSERILKSAWMPFRSIPDEEYEATLKQKISKLDHEIAVVDSQLAALQRQRDVLAKTT